VSGLRRRCKRNKARDAEGTISKRRKIQLIKKARLMIARLPPPVVASVNKEAGTATLEPSSDTPEPSSDTHAQE
jgi:hypothetical protein